MGGASLEQSQSLGQLPSLVYLGQSPTVLWSSSLESHHSLNDDHPQDGHHSSENISMHLHYDLSCTSFYQCGEFLCMLELGQIQEMGKTC